MELILNPKLLTEEKQLTFKDLKEDDTFTIKENLDESSWVYIKTRLIQASDNLSDANAFILNLYGRICADIISPYTPVYHVNEFVIALRPKS